MSEAELGFGYNRGLQGATVAWGARWIIKQDGYVDFVPDRQDMIGEPDEKQELLEWLNKVVGNKPNDALAEMLRNYRLSTREDKEVVLYEDDRGIVMGSPQSSAGYFYVLARWHVSPHVRTEPTGETVTCPDCQGFGYHEDDTDAGKTCPTCQGDGTVPEIREVTNAE